jgi:hypothetical protein
MEVSDGEKNRSNNPWHSACPFAFSSSAGDILSALGPEYSKKILSPG